MNILMIGSGGREHALILKLKKSKYAPKIYCAPGNGGISKDAQCVDIPVMDFDAIIDFSLKNKIDLVFVAPDDPLAAGLVDALEAKGIRAFGPNKAAAIIEGSKAFSKELMKKYGIPTASFEVFDNSEDALNYIKTQNSFPTVIKADGLALGKGVIIAECLAEAENAIKSIIEDKIFGDSGSKIVIEDFLQGPEVSVLAFTDGKTITPMASAKDHKRAHNGDKGLNTGGMGTISPNPYYDAKIENECMDKIFLPTIKAMEQEGRPFKGCLFFGLMITKNGVKVIEYNCRFGDPETQVVIKRLQTDLIDIIDAVIDEKLDNVDIKWNNNSVACVVIASGGYPLEYKKGIEIRGLNEDGQLENATVYHAGTKIENGKFVTSGGRILGVTCEGETLERALENSYEAVKKISIENSFYRTDIGKN